MNRLISLLLNSIFFVKPIFSFNSGIIKFLKILILSSTLYGLTSNSINRSNKIGSILFESLYEAINIILSKSVGKV